MLGKFFEFGRAEGTLILTEAEPSRGMILPTEAEAEPREKLPFPGQTEAEASVGHCTGDFSSR